MNQPIRDAYALLDQCRQEINILLQPYNTLRAGVNQRIELIKTQLNNSAVILEPAQEQPKSGRIYPPITKIKGKEINRPNAVLPEQYSAEQPEVELLKKNAQQLYDNFLKLKPRDILNSYNTKEGENALRTVAKWAGFEDFKERKLTEQFMEEIAKAIVEKENDKATQEKFHEDLSKSKEKVIVSDGHPDDSFEVNITYEPEDPPKFTPKSTSTKRK